jgi:hypothetical protein
MTKQERSTAKRGPQRKSRRLRLPVSFMCGEFEFAPSEEDWKKIAKAYPYLADGDRCAIADIATTFLMFAPYETRAPFLDDAMAWLKEVGKAAEIFWNAAHRQPPTDIEQRAALHAQSVVARNIKHFALPDGMEWSVLTGIMTNVVAALQIVARDLPGEAVGGFVEGQFWNSFVCQLTDYVNERGYPSGASKGVDKSASGATSEFVALVRELQRLFPEECRRHTASDMALAEGIAVARRMRRAKRKIKSETQAS